MRKNPRDVLQPCYECTHWSLQWWQQIIAKVTGVGWCESMQDHTWRTYTCEHFSQRE